MRRRRLLAATGLSALGGCLRLTATEGTGTETADGSATTGATTDDDPADDTTTESAPAPLAVESAWLWPHRPSTTALGEDALYVGTSDGVAALDFEAGERWTATTDLSIGSVAPTENGVVAVGTASGDEDSGAILRVDLDGEIGGRTDVDRPLSSLTVAEGTAFAGVFGTESGREGPILFAFDRNELTRRWTASQFSEDSVSGVSVADGTALVGYANHFATYSVDDGSRGLSTDWGVSGRPLVDDGVAYLTTHAGVRALDVASGLEQWSFESDGPLTAPTLADGTLYVGGWDGLYAVESDGSNGRKLIDTGGEEVYVTTPPAFHAGYVWILTVDDRLLAVEPTHEQVLFETRLDGRGQWLAGSGDRLYVAHDAGVEAFTVQTP
jgi:hypothetical protein